MLGSLHRSEAQFEALERVETWTRQRFALPADAVVMVSELACAMPGCPPLETVVVFWSAEGTRHHFRMFKPVADVVEEDLPFAWLKDSLAVPEGFVCECC